MAALPDSTGKLTGKAKEIYDEILARRSAQGAKVRGLYIPLMNHPELTQLIERLGYYLKFEGKLPRDAYQFIVSIHCQKNWSGLRVGRSSGACSSLGPE